MVPVFVPLILGVVQAVRVDRSGIVADVILLPDGDGPYPARMALPGAGVEHGGPYIPLEKDDTVLLACPNGDPGDGFLLLGRFFEEAEPVPAAIVDNPTDERWVAKPERQLVLQTSRGNLTLLSLVEGGESRVSLTDAGDVEVVPAPTKKAKLGSDADADLVAVALGPILRGYLDAHTHLAGTLVVGMTAVTGVTGPPTAASPAAIDSSNVVAKK